MDPDRSIDAELVEQYRAGDDGAFGRLYDRWLDRVVDLARRIVGDETALDVAQDTFLKAHDSLGDLRDADAFGGWLLRIARNRALDRLGDDRRAALVDAEAMTMIESTDAAATSGSAALDVFDRLDGLEDPEQVAADKEVAALVWGAATALGERDATVLDLHLRHNMSPAEIGEVVGVNRNAANQLVHRLRSRLERAVASRVLWRDGRPDCTDLAAVLAEAGVQAFDQEAIRLAERHAEDCERCERRRAGLLAPSALFSSVPIVAVPQLDARRVAARLADDGVPMSGSTHVGHRRSRWSRRRSVLTAAVAGVLVLVVVGVWMFARDEGAQAPVSAREAVAASPPTNPPDASTTTTTQLIITVTTAPPVNAAPPPPEPDIAPDPGSPAPQPPAPAAPASVTASVAPSSVPDVYPMTPGSAPTVTWSVSGATSVSASGPGLSSTSPSGSQLVCPGTINSSLCQATPGTYSYTVTGTNAAGQTTQRTVSLTVA